MRKLITLVLGLSVLGLGACRDTSGLDGNASLQDRQEILAALAGSGYAGEDLGTDGPEANFQIASVGDNPSAVAAAASAAGTVTLPALWGFRLGAPVARNRTVDVQNDTATVKVVLDFDGQFLMILPRQGEPAQTVTKPAVVTMTQSAVLVKNPTVNAADPSGDLRHRWKLLQITPQNWQLKDEAKRTTEITRVQVLVNGVTKIEVTDPAHLFDVNNRLPRLNRGDVVQVLVDVDNTAGTGNTPPTFVFLHVMHADPSGLRWRRLPMQQTGEGSFQLSWVVRLSGRDRLTVQALDSQTFQTEAGTEVRGNAWAIPYRIE